MALKGILLAIIFITIIKQKILPHGDHPTTENQLQLSNPWPSQQYFDVIFWKNRHQIRNILSKCPAQRRCLALLVILLCGDVETNPGPTRASIYPCGICQDPVTWSCKGICCDTCNIWFHHDCADIGSREYSAMSHSAAIWLCPRCDNVNCCSFTFRSYELESPNPFELLKTNFDSTPPLEPFSPPRTSTPKSKPNVTTQKPPKNASPLTRSSIHSHSLTTTSSASDHPLPKKGKNWRSLILNINGLRDKAPLLQNLVNYIKPDVIIGCETKITEKVNNAEILPPDYQSTVLRKDRTDSGGGVLLAFKEGYVVTPVKDSNGECEAIWASVQIPKQAPLHICSFYRPPGSGSKPLEELSKTIGEINKRGNKHIVIAGDMNCGNINWETETINPSPNEPSAHTALLDLLQEHSLTNTQHEPTRENRTLDIHLTTQPSLVKAQRVIPGISDHDAIVVDSDIRPKHNSAPPRKVFKFHKADWDAMKQETKTFQDRYKEEEDQRSTNKNWLEIKSHLNQMLDKHCPWKARTTRHNLPWMTPCLRRQIRRKRRLYNKARKTKNPNDWSAFKSARKKVNQNLKSAHSNYINSTLTEAVNKGEHKTFWNYIKSKRKDTNGVAPLMSNGSLFSEDKDLAEILSNQFTSVFTKDKMEDVPKLKGDPFPAIDDIQVTENGVLKLLKNLNTSKAPGPDCLPNRILKELATELAPSLTLLFNQTLSLGKLPDDWKNANVSPIFKKDDKHQAANYRPVSLTCVCAKLMEHIIVSHLMKHLDKHEILTELQHGFRRNRSCTTQLLLTVSDLTRLYDSNTQVDIGVLDFSKAFDVVNHRKLLAKLQHYGIQGKTLQWIRSFLEDRSQQVVVNGTSSKPAPVLSGVPQGTVLGPILFLIYINDITEGIRSKLRLFADDALLYCPIKTEADHVQLQQDLKTLENWAEKWDMKFNAKKCYIMSNKRQGAKSTRLYSLCDTILETVHNIHYLGVLINDDMSFTAQVDTISAKASRTLGFLKRNLKNCPEELRKTAFTTMCRPVLEYAAPVWDPHLAGDVAKLEKVQRRGARFVKNDYRRTSSVTTMLEDLQWVPLKERRQNARLVLFYQIVNEEIAIPKDPELLIPGNRGRFKHLSHKHSAYKHSFYPNTIREWNGLDPKIKSCLTVDMFKARLSAEESKRRI